MFVQHIPKLEVQCMNRNISSFYFMPFFPSMFTDLLCATHLILCASLCKLFPEVSMPLSWHEEMIFVSISPFTPPFVLSFLFSFFV